LCLRNSALTFTVMPSTSKAEILKASAGSGKTFKLAKEFIKLLILNPNDYHQILALTFTNDAKNEMKSRILKELTKLASQEYTILLIEIENDFKNNNIPLTKSQIYHRSNLGLSNILNDYSRFNVVTLDHFFTQLIRHLARELKLSLGYELDLDVNKALDESIQKLYTSKNKKIKKWLQAFINSKIEEDKGWNIEFNIKNLGNKLFQDSFIDLKDKLSSNVDNLEGFVAELKKSIKDYKTAMQIAGKQALEIIHFHGLTEADFRAHTAIVFKKLSEEKQNLNSPFSATFLKGEWTTKSSANKDEIEACANAGLNDIHEKIVALANGKKKQAFFEASNLISNIYSYGVLSALSDNLWAYKSTNNLLLLSDTSFILNGVVSLSDAPFIYEKIGAKYRNIMIDEFQDTSTYQWKNILPLLQYALFEEGNVLLVGDVKQSIYRWRGGDASLLMYKAAADLTNHTPIQNALETNYRSGKNIVAFNNAFFTIASSTLNDLVEGFSDKQQDLIDAYSDVNQKASKGFNGYVKAQFFKDSDEGTWVEQAFEATEKTIQQALAENFQPEDILILVRKNKEAGEIAAYLLSKGIHTITDEALQLSKSPVVQFIINALQLIVNPGNNLTQSNFSYFLNIIRNKPARESLELPLENLSFSAYQANLTAYEIIEKLIEEYHLEKQFDPFLQGLQDLSLSVSQQGYTSITSFLERWGELNEEEKSKPSIILGKPKGAVQVKTIHKSKGLESPVVILPQIHGSIFNSRHVFWPTDLPDRYIKWASLPLKLTNKLIETTFAPNYNNETYEIALEELNTLYVGFTRAVERLYIFSVDKNLKNSLQEVIKGVFANPTFEFSSQFTENVFELGTQEKAQSYEDDLAKNIQLNAYPVSSPELKLEITNENNFWKQLDTDRANQIQEGIILHAIMAQLKVFKIPELDLLLNNILHLMVLGGEISLSESAIYKNKILELFNKLPKLHQWFTPGWEVINEHKILANGQVYVPDRIVLKENRAIIIDFKKELKSDSHQKQIKNYSNLLSKMGYKIDGMFLVYIEHYEIEEVL
jgi:ATP-dependent exoDNAse (exonuclease V) beta subunit